MPNLNQNCPICNSLLSNLYIESNQYNILKHDDSTIICNFVFVGTHYNIIDSIRIRKDNLLIFIEQQKILLIYKNNIQIDQYTLDKQYTVNDLASLYQNLISITNKTIQNLDLF